MRFDRSALLRPRSCPFKLCKRRQTRRRSGFWLKGSKNNCRPTSSVQLPWRPPASARLLEQARLNQVPEKAWPGIAASLAGNYIQYGNRLFGSTAPPVVWSKEQIELRLQLIDQMIAASTNPAGKQVLQNAYAQTLS